VAYWSDVSLRVAQRCMCLTHRRLREVVYIVLFQLFCAKQDTASIVFIPTSVRLCVSVPLRAKKNHGLDICCNLVEICATVKVGK